MQMAGIDNLQVEKKGAIDLVTQIDRDVEQMFRALIARALSRSRRPRGGVRAARRPPERGGVLLGVRSGRRHDELRARPADLLLRLLARAQRPADRRRDLRSEPARALHRRARRRRVAQRRADARVGGGHADRLAALHRVSLHGADRRRTTCSGCFGDFLERGARGPSARHRAAIDLAYVAAGRFDGFWEVQAEPLGHLGRGAADRRGGRPGEHARPASRSTRGSARSSRRTAASTPQMVDVDSCSKPDELTCS